MISNRTRGRLALLTAGVLLTAGCRNTSPVSAEADDRGAEQLSGAQVADVQVALARTLESRGDARQATSVYAEAVRRDPKRPDAWGRLAVLADREGRFDESEKCYRRAIELQPNNPDTFCNLGYSLYLQHRWAEAEAALNRAVTLKPDHRRAHTNLGLVLARMGRGPEALSSFHRAGCSEVDAHTNLAYASTLNGDWEGAREQYQLALQLQPDSDTARAGLERVAALAAATARPTDTPPTAPGTGVVQAAATTLPTAPPTGSPVCSPTAP